MKGTQKTVWVSRSTYPIEHLWDYDKPLADRIMMLVYQLTDVGHRISNHDLRNVLLPGTDKKTETKRLQKALDTLTRKKLVTRAQGVISLNLDVALPPTERGHKGLKNLMRLLNESTPHRVMIAPLGDKLRGRMAKGLSAITYRLSEEHLIYLLTTNVFDTPSIWMPHGSGKKVLVDEIPSGFIADITGALKDNALACETDAYEVGLMFAVKALYEMRTTVKNPGGMLRTLLREVNQPRAGDGNKINQTLRSFNEWYPLVTEMLEWYPSGETLTKLQNKSEEIN